MSTHASAAGIKAAAFSLIAATAALSPAIAQVTGQYPQQGQYPAPAQYPQPGQYPAPSPATPPYAPAGAYPPDPATAYGQPAGTARPPSIRELFAGSLGLVLNTVGGGAVTAITSSLAGGINNWFARKQARVGTAAIGVTREVADPYAQAPQGAYSQPQPGYPQQAYPPQAYPQQGNPQQGATYPAPAAYGAPSAVAPAYPQPGVAPNAPPYTTTYYNPTTGAQVTDAAAQYGQTPALAGGTTDPGASAFAGIAYEVHALGAGGASAPVNPANYVFRSGDRFVVYYRPSMPGRMTVYNINPAGVQSQIDASTMAAGQLSTLGPYEFANSGGNEQLRLVLTPCSTPNLLVASRDIVNVSGYDAQRYPASSSAMPANAGTPGVRLSSCDAPATRAVPQAGAVGNGVQTRDIRKVALEGTTSFALDPVSRQELQSGDLAPREVTIRFTHQ